MESRRNFECPQDGTRCTACLKLAEHVMSDELRREGYGQQQADVLAENSGLRAQIEESGDISFLECDDRQVRAIKIAKRSAEARKR